MILTDKQLEDAAKAMYAVADHGGHTDLKGLPWAYLHPIAREDFMRCARAAAPFLQAPWHMPENDEIVRVCEHAGSVAAVNADSMASKHIGMREALQGFINRRNDALATNPVDPRRAKIRNVLFNMPGYGVDDTADRILAALDAKD